jgi:diphthamide biosynthesis protein 2
MIERFDLIKRYNIESTVRWILSLHGLHVIALQFPDDSLSDAAEVSHALQERLPQGFDLYVLADTTYNSLSVDEVASEHVKADCIVHYGRASLSRTSGRVPVHYVFPQEDRYRLSESNIQSLPLEKTDSVVCFVDQAYQHVMEDAKEYLRSVIFAGIAEVKFPPVLENPGDASLGGYSYPRVTDGEFDPDGSMRSLHVWYGPADSPARDQLMLTLNSYNWLSIDPIEESIERGLPLKMTRVLRKRYFLVDKARQASIVGILVGTLAAEGYKESINALRLAAKRASKKTYTLLMGKPNPAKLANFPEIDIFILVADPQGQILDSKEYYAPIITPYEAMIAFSDDTEWEEHKYSLELVTTISPNCHDGHDGHDGGVEGTSDSMALALQAQEALQVADTRGSTKDIIASSSAEYLIHKRTWKGVESGNRGNMGHPPAAIEKGRTGRAAMYDEG